MEACNYMRNKLVGYYTQQCLANILHNASGYGNHRKVQLLYITYITLFDIKHVQFLYILINVFHCSECQ